MGQITVMTGPERRKRCFQPTSARGMSSSIRDAG